jgi:hypothetical protein
LIIGFAGAIIVFMLLYRSLPEKAELLQGGNALQFLGNTFRTGLAGQKEEGTGNKFCTACGSKVEKGQPFCSQCGAKL